MLKFGGGCVKILKTVIIKLTQHSRAGAVAELGNLNYTKRGDNNNRRHNALAFPLRAHFIQRLEPYRDPSESFPHLVQNWKEKKIKTGGK